MFLRLLSYLIPINIFKTKSKISKTLEVTWANGELVLDTLNTNYSYGSLQRILKKGLKVVGFEKILEMQSILILGVAAGSVIKTLTHEINFTGEITGVEIDEEIIKIGNDFFNLNEIQNLEIIIEDAYKFVLKTKKKYDLIVVDIFEDNKMPNFLYEKYFIERLCFILNIKGFIVFNTMVLNGNYQNNLFYKKQFDLNDFKLSSIPNLEGFNELIIVEKI